MKKLTEYIHNKYVSLKGLDESVVERLSNMEGYEITEYCGSYSDDCYGYDEPCDGSCETTCAGKAVPVAAAPIVQDPVTKYRGIFASAPKVMDLYNAHNEFTYKCRFVDEYQRSDKEPLIFVNYNYGCGALDCCYQNSKKLHDDILTICSLIGGSAGILLAILLFDRKAVKDNMMSRVFIACVFVIEVIILLMVKGHHADHITLAFWEFFAKYKILLIYLAVINFIAFAAYAVDKVNAAEHRSRIRIVTLLGLAFVGGSVGSLLAMYLLRHKTRKNYFTVGVPLIMVMQVVVIFYAMNAGW